MAKKPENPGECESCGFVTNNLQLFAEQATTIGGGGQSVTSDFWYCDLCCSTPTSTYDRYPNQSPSNMQVMRTVCYVGNVLLAAMGKEVKP